MAIKRWSRKQNVVKVVSVSVAMWVGSTHSLLKPFTPFRHTLAAPPNLSKRTLTPNHWLSSVLFNAEDEKLYNWKFLTTLKPPHSSSFFSEIRMKGCDCRGQASLHVGWMHDATWDSTSYSSFFLYFKTKGWRWRRRRGDIREMSGWKGVGGVLCAFVDSNCLKQEGYSANERSQAKAKKNKEKKKK